MRKFMFLFVLCGLISGQAWGDVSNFNLVVKPNDPGADEYIEISDRGYAECYDGGHGSVKEGNYVYIYTGGTDVAKRKCVHDFLDYKWELAGDLGWCSGSQLSDGYGSDYIFEGRNFGVRIPGGNTSKLAERARDYVLASTSGTACVICKSGYEQKGNDCVEKVKGCTYLGQTVNPGFRADSADVDTCKEVYGDWSDADKIKSCTAMCEDSGTMRYYISTCVDGYKRGDKTLKAACVEEGGNNDDNRGKDGGNNDDNRGGGDAVVGKCHPSVCYEEVCIECCKRPSSETIWDRTARVCQCVNGGKFQKENNTWSCKVDAGQVTTPDAGYICDATLTAKFAGWKVQCATRTDIMQSIAELEAYCAGKPTKEIFLRLYDEVSVMARMCQQQQQDQRQQQEEQRRQEERAKAEALRRSRRNISDAHGILVGMRETFKASVWKDEEGKFNTSRLVSDSIAGVVLGTVGGVVTSNVVKKNQVENGFEDIKCTVGGQTVADWGDEFRVGIQ